MSLQVFLHARFTGAERFLAESNRDVDTRVRWLALLAETLPRALLAELGLARILLGSSGGEQFLVVIPAEFRAQAEELLARAADEIDRMTSGALRLVSAATENLGDWSDVRKRLNEQFQAALTTPLTRIEAQWDAFVPSAAPFFRNPGGVRLREAMSVGWSPEEPATIRMDGGKHTWPLDTSEEAIPVARHTALSDDGERGASLEELAERATGRKTWGVLRGDVDRFASRLARAVSVEEHIQLSLLYKNFFASELEMLCSQGEFFQRLTLLASGGDSFAVYGSHSALLPFAREVQRLFQRLVETTTLRELAGNEGKTLTMGMAVAQWPDETLDDVFHRAGEAENAAKASGRDGIGAFGRVLDWQEMAAAAESKAVMTRMVNEFGVSPQFLYELASFYRGSGGDVRRGRGRNDRVDRPWRFHRRLNRVTAGSLSASRNKEFQRLRTELVADFTGRNAAQIRLRPAGRVALEWAKAETEV